MVLEQVWPIFDSVSQLTSGSLNLLTQPSESSVSCDKHTYHEFSLLFQCSLLGRYTSGNQAESKEQIVAAKDATEILWDKRRPVSVFLILFFSLFSLSHSLSSCEGFRSSEFYSGSNTNCIQTNTPWHEGKGGKEEKQSVKCFHLHGLSLRFLALHLPLRSTVAGSSWRCCFPCRCRLFN